jgi:hypothetical protein
MSPLLDLSWLAELMQPPISWSIMVAATVIAGLTLAGLTARLLTWLGSIRP